MNVECSSCHVDVGSLGQDSPLYVTQCGHICCIVCRDNWFGKDHNTCPRCRKPQTRSTLIRLFYDLSDPDISDPRPSTSSGACQSPAEPKDSCDRDALDDACADLAHWLVKEESYPMLTHRTSKCIDAIMMNTEHTRRPLNLVKSALTDLSLKHTTLQRTHESLLSVHRASKREATSTAAALRDEIKHKDEQLQQCWHEVAASESRWKQRATAIFNELNVARARLETQSAELAASNVESARLLRNNLHWKKKYHALKQEVSQARKHKTSDVDESLVIV